MLMKKINIILRLMNIAKHINNERLKIVIDISNTRMEDFVDIYLICLKIVGRGVIIYGMYKIRKSKKKNKKK